MWNHIAFDGTLVVYQFVKVIQIKVMCLFIDFLSIFVQIDALGVLSILDSLLRFSKWLKNSTTDDEDVFNKCNTILSKKKRLIDCISICERREIDERK